MGETYARVAIRGLGKETVEEMQLLVDTGSIYSWLRAETLRSLGVKPRARRVFNTIEGKSIEIEVGDAFVEYDGEAAPTVIVFGLSENAEVLGLHALESLGLEVDPVSCTLRRSGSLLAV